MATAWGRKETIIWPPHQPLWTYGSIMLTLLCTCAFVWLRFHFLETPLQQTYTSAYLRSAVGEQFHQHGKYRLLYLTGPQKVPRLLLPADFENGKTTLPSGKVVPVQLSAEAVNQGYQSWYFAPEQGYTDASLARWFRGAIFEGKGLTAEYELSFIGGAVVLLIALFFAVPADANRYRSMKYGRRLRGPVMMDPKEFNRAQQATEPKEPLRARMRRLSQKVRRKKVEEPVRGIGFKTTEMRAMMRVPVRKEAQHFQLMGDTGVGKTQLIMQVLRQIRERGDSAIVYDPACEYIQRFFDNNRGDIVLNPLDERCPYWAPASEMESNAEADAIAEALYQPTTAAKDEFFHETPAQIFAHLLKQGPTPHQLAAWMADANELEKLVAGTEMSFYIDRKAGPQRAGVLASLGLVAKSLRLLPEEHQTTTKWNARTWAKQRKGWIFITSRPPERETLRPLHSLWIDLLVMRLLSAPQPGQKHVWFVIDELASLQKLPQLHTAITENRKSKNPLVLGFQGKAQLEVIYGHLAEVMLSQPATKIYMKTAEPRAAEWISEALGKVEIERLKETKFDGSRSGKNFTLDRQVEPLVLSSEISGLDDRHAFLKLGNNVARFAFDYLDLPTRTEGFIKRKSADGEMSFDPDTLEKRPSSAPAAPKPALPPERTTALASAPATIPPASFEATVPVVLKVEQEEAEPQPETAEVEELDEDDVPEEMEEAHAAMLAADDPDTPTCEDEDATEDEDAVLSNTFVAGGY